MTNEKDLPDNVAPNPHSLPYASNVGAPVIRPDHSLGGWKIGAVHSANKHYEERFNKLKKEVSILHQLEYNSNYEGLEEEEQDQNKCWLLLNKTSGPKSK